MPDLQPGARTLSLASLGSVQAEGSVSPNDETRRRLRAIEANPVPRQCHVTLREGRRAATHVICAGLFGRLVSFAALRPKVNLDVSPENARQQRGRQRKKVQDTRCARNAVARLPD